jgi:pyrroline-5-carboxylate reductase
MNTQMNTQMDTTGFIGFGNMGGTLLKALIKFGAIAEDRIVVTTRTPGRLNDFLKQYPAVKEVGNVSEVGSACRRVFLCTGTREVKPVLTELARYLPQNAHVITITGSIEFRCLETIFTGGITKVMPTMISEVGEGVTLVCHNDKVPSADREFISTVFCRIGLVKEITEKQVDLAADLTSCAPAFFAAILRTLMEAAKNHGDFPPEELSDLILRTCQGTTRLLLANKNDFDGLMSRVATRGGITAEGLKVLEAKLPEVFDDLLNITLSKREMVKRQIRTQYGLE